jgi:hypothetical protein
MCSFIQDSSECSIVAKMWIVKQVQDIGIVAKEMMLPIYLTCPEVRENVKFTIFDRRLNNINPDTNAKDPFSLKDFDLFSILRSFDIASISPSFAYSTEARQNE